MNQNKRHENILVTGGAGFIGSALAARLVTEGYNVTVADNLSTGLENNIPSGARFVNVDLGELGDSSELESLPCDAIFHLAGQSSGEGSFKDPLYDLKSHVLSNYYLLDYLKRKGGRRFIYSSSMSVYGDPDYLPVTEESKIQPKTFYGAAKVSAEAYINLYNKLELDTTIFRLFSVYGPGQNLDNKTQGMISIFLSYMLEGVPIIVKGSLNRFRDFTYIDDVIETFMAALYKPVSFGQTYNLCAGGKTTVGELLNAMKEVSGEPDYPVTNGPATPGDQFGVFGDNKKMQDELHCKPTVDIHSGLRKMIEFEKKNLGG